MLYYHENYTLEHQTNLPTALGKLHELKEDPVLFNINSNLQNETFQLRLNDRDFKPGDILGVRETANPSSDIEKGVEIDYTNKYYLKRITGVMAGLGLKPNWVILFVRNLTHEEFLKIPKDFLVTCANIKGM